MGLAEGYTNGRCPARVESGRFYSQTLPARAASTSTHDWENE
jgi:hypothetical protein